MVLFYYFDIFLKVSLLIIIKSISYDKFCTINIKHSLFDNPAGFIMDRGSFRVF